jgi:2-haloacid dehalogenase
LSGLIGVNHPPKEIDMQKRRRDFLQLLAAGAAAAAAPTRSSPGRPLRYKAIAFDAFPIFDPRPIAALTERTFPGRGAELVNAWRTRQFEYQWLRVLGGRYADFLQTTEEALVFAAKQLKLDLRPDDRTKLKAAWSNLQAWPDAAQSLTALRDAGIRLAFLSNMTEAMLRAGIANAGLDGLFEQVLSTDHVRTYKPDPRGYRLGVDALALTREEILFVAFAGWDAAGAKWFGYPVFWVNRLGAPAEELGAVVDGVGRGLADLVAFVQGPRSDSRR